MRRVFSPKLHVRMHQWRSCAATASADAAAQVAEALPKKNRTISRWLFASGGAVATIVVVGGITRLTESGLSMVTWKPLSIMPPTTKEAWEVEFEQYKKFPEFQQRSDMTVDEFKMIFFWEWFHRVLARSMGLVYGVPLIYFGARGYFKGQPKLKMILSSFLLLGGAQGFMGWYMVKSGLDNKLLEDKKKATVSAYRLASHLTLAFIIFSGIMRTGFGLRYIKPIPKFEQFTAVQMAARTAFTIMFATAVSGAAVAGLDAGLLYNDGFPLMGGRVIPPTEELFPYKPWYRNFFECGSLAQTWHRIMAGLTTTAVIGVNVAARRGGAYGKIPANVRRAILHVNGAVCLQASLGIAALLSYVDISLAAAHQSGSMVLLTTLIRLCAVLGTRGAVLA